MPSPAVHPLSSTSRLEDLSRAELIELLEERGEGGIHIDFSGKGTARKLARRVRPRVARTIKKYSVGADHEQARNVVIEGDNLQAMATLFREQGQVDLILTDPPYNTGNDWRYKALRSFVWKRGLGNIGTKSHAKDPWPANRRRQRRVYCARWGGRV